jgi:hypothetical protein
VAKSNKVGVEDLLIGCWFRKANLNVISPLFNTRFLALKLYGEKFAAEAIIGVHLKENWMQRLHESFAQDEIDEGLKCPMDDFTTPCMKMEEPRVVLPTSAVEERWRFAIGQQTKEQIYARGCCGLNGEDAC